MKLLGSFLIQEGDQYTLLWTLFHVSWLREPQGIETFDGAFGRKSERKKTWRSLPPIKLLLQGVYVLDSLLHIPISHYGTTHVLLDLLLTSSEIRKVSFGFIIS